MYSLTILECSFRTNQSVNFVHWSVFKKRRSIDRTGLFPSSVRRFRNVFRKWAHSVELLGLLSHLGFFYQNWVCGREHGLLTVMFNILCFWENNGVQRSKPSSSKWDTPLSQIYKILGSFYVRNKRATGKEYYLFEIIL
jgi:ribosomal protein S14